MTLKSISQEEQHHFKEISKLFGIENISTIVENTKGEFNRIFFLTTKTNKKFVLRESYKQTKKSSVIFETTLLKELEKLKFDLVPRIIPTTSGEPFVEIKGTFYIMQSFLEGDNPYFWYSDNYTKEQFDNCYQTLALFHNVLRKINIRKPEKPINRKLEDLKKSIKLCIRQIKKQGNENFGEYLTKNEPFIVENINNCSDLLEQYDYDKFPKQIIHNDYHMGNLNFIDGKVSGIFDFDWAQEDTILWDMAYSLMQACATWNKKNELDRKKCKRALAIYNKFATKKIIKENEIRILQVLLKVAEIFNINWALNQYCNKKDDCYFDFLKHNVLSLRYSEFENIF